MKLPIVPHASPQLDAARLRRAEELAVAIRGEQPELVFPRIFRSQRTGRLGEGAALHLDDLAAIPLLDRFYDTRFLETRARLRAVDGDFVASCTTPVAAYEQYCEQRLGLGTVTWLSPRPISNPLSVASACWSDRKVRHRLVNALRKNLIRYLHPHMGSHSVWAVGLLLSEASGRPLSIVAPPPALCQRVNDKIWFAEVVRRLFGSEFVPRSYDAQNYATAAHLVRWLSIGERQIVLKVPDSAGGRGNLVLPPEQFRGRPVGKIRIALRELLDDLDWQVGDRLLVGTWESDVLCAPSAQLWIPPEAEGLPVVEGLFLQSVGSDVGKFLGSTPARFPSSVSEHLLGHCWLLARFFQRLDYVGRCSFDMLLVGNDLDDCRLQFLECNGRWGGTSTPMTLMNRLFGDWQEQPYAAHKIEVPGLEKLEFTDLLRHFDRDLYDARSGQGSLVLFAPGRLAITGGIDVIALGHDWNEANHRLAEEIPERLAELVQQHLAKDSLRMAFLEDHQVLTRGLSDIRSALAADDLDLASRLARSLDAAAGAHIEFEEGFFYPELRKLLGDEFVDRLYEEHAAGKHAIELLATNLVSEQNRQELDRDLDTAMNHVLSCGSLLSHLEGLTTRRHSELLGELRACRSHGQAWTSLERPVG